MVVFVADGRAKKRPRRRSPAPGTYRARSFIVPTRDRSGAASPMPADHTEDAAMPTHNTRPAAHTVFFASAARRLIAAFALVASLAACQESVLTRMGAARYGDRSGADSPALSVNSLTFDGGESGGP